MGVMQQFNEPNIITTSTDRVFNWARKNSLWPLQFGLACCAIEMMSTGMGHNDLERFGSSPFMGSPRQADVMIVSGTVSTKMAERITRLYEQMPEPKWVIAMGACAISGGPFLDGYSVLMGADRVIPVDVYVPGCPPRPEALIFGILTLQKKVERDSQIRYDKPRPALVDDEGNIREYLPEREYTNISEGKADRPAGIKPMPRTYVFERKGMPPGPQTDVGWIPPETKKKLKAEEKARKEAEKAKVEKAEAGEGQKSATATAEKEPESNENGSSETGAGKADSEKKGGE
jgi:NADH-quinone oxidoreductase subunit B